MKKMLIICSLLVATAAHAQWVVYDPANTIQSVINTAQEIAKYIEMINNQVQQIKMLTSQLDELQKYNEAFGNPAKLLNIAGVNGLTRDLRKTDTGQSIEQVRRVSQGTDAFAYDGSGIYASIGQTFKTPSGTEVEREARIYRDNAAIQRAAQNYTKVFDDVRERRRALKDEIAATIGKLQSAETDAEVQKLTGVLVGLNAALAATDKEVDQALGLAIVQEVENRNDTERQTEARAEEQRAEFSETLKNFKRTFRPDIKPAVFPER